jgi:two-component system, chemotaxis family, protein-glutamate methylesterase/glutaminase
MRRSRDIPARVLAIAASTGGPQALAILLAHLPRPFPAPIVIVQHIPDTFSARLAEQLSAASGFPAVVAGPGVTLAPDTIVVAAGGRHMKVKREGFGVRAYLDDGPPENACRPSADVLFRSVAAVFGPETLAVVLTGVGRDGAAGCELIHRAGGHVLVQDEASSVAWGMARAAVKAGIVNKVLPLDGLAGEIARLVFTLSAGDHP